MKKFLLVFLFSFSFSINAYSRSIDRDKSEVSDTLLMQFQTLYRLSKKKDIQLDELDFVYKNKLDDMTMWGIKRNVAKVTDNVFISFLPEEEKNKLLISQKKMAREKPERD